MQLTTYALVGYYQHHFRKFNSNAMCVSINKQLMGFVI